MPRPTVAEAQGREAIFHDPMPADPVMPAAPVTVPPVLPVLEPPVSARPPLREERIARKTYHLPRDLIRRVADAASPDLTQSQIVAAGIRLYFDREAPAGE
jgi:hypothetical protein